MVVHVEGRTCLRAEDFTHAYMLIPVHYCILLFTVNIVDSNLPKLHIVVINIHLRLVYFKTHSRQKTNARRRRIEMCVSHQMIHIELEEHGGLHTPHVQCRVTSDCYIGTSARADLNSANVRDTCIRKTSEARRCQVLTLFNSSNL